MKFLFTKQHANILFPFSLLTITILAYGLFLGQTGFYWDEWPFLWYHHAYGTEGVLKYFAHNRPFWGYLYATTMPLLGNNPVVWQIFGLILRFLTGMIFWWVLRLIWPKRTWAAAAAAALFVVYPSFMQQSISLMYGHFFIVLIAFLLSLAWMILAHRLPCFFILYTILAMLASAVNLFCMEYFFGLELLRPFILFIVLQGAHPTTGRRLLAAGKHWLPYLLVVAAYLYWRVFLFQFPTYQPEGVLGGHFLQTIWQLILAAFANLKVVLLDIWTNLANPPELQTYGDWLGGLYWVVVIATLLIVTGLFGSRILNRATPQRRTWHDMLLLSIPALLLAGIPFMVTDLKLGLDYPRDRFTLPFMLGGSLFFVGLLSLLPLKQTWRALLLGVIVSLSAGLQMVHGSTFKADWELQKNLYWQLYWRAPALQTGTLVIAEELPSIFESDNSLTAPLNWMYAPDFTGEDIPYLFAFASVRTETGVLELKPHTGVEQFYRLGTFHGNTDAAIVLHYEPGGCIWLLDPARDTNLPDLKQLIREALPLSRPEQVISAVSETGGPAVFAGAELEHEWCYYFQKAELARREGDWEKVVSLAAEAAEKGYDHREASEELVFIEGYIRTAAWQKAYKLTGTVFEEKKDLRRVLCHIWEDALAGRDTPDSGKAALSQSEELLGCLLLDTKE